MQVMNIQKTRQALAVRPQLALPSFPLDFAVERVRKENPKLTEKDLCSAERAYRRFLLICKQNPKISVRPTILVDEMWHAHILHTPEYHRDCTDFFGYYLHHRPIRDAEKTGTSMSLFSTRRLAQCSDDGCGSGCEPR